MREVGGVRSAMQSFSADSGGARFERVDHGETVTVYIHGEVDIAERQQFRSAIRDALSVARRSLYLDLSDVSFMDSSGVHALLDARREAMSSNTDLLVLAPSTPVLRVLQVCCLDDLFQVCDRLDGPMPPLGSPSSR